MLAKFCKYRYSGAFIFCIIFTCSYAQGDITLHIGDKAPVLRVSNWVKGEPILDYKKGTVYVIEFWATWCLPCKAAMPHLSGLAKRYKDNVVVVGVDVMEGRKVTRENIISFVDSMGSQMNYTVAIQDSNYAERDWLEASGENLRYGIPRTFVVDGNGRLAWIGHPSKLGCVLPKIVDMSWNVEEVRNIRKTKMYIQELEDSLNFELIEYRATSERPGKPYEAMAFINKVLEEEPRLQYAPRIAFHTLSALISIDKQRAYEYGMNAIAAEPVYHDSPAYDIAGYIKVNPAGQEISPELYKLAAFAYQKAIEDTPYPELTDLPRDYREIARLFWLSNDKHLAILVQQKAIKISRCRGLNSMTKELESGLEEYIK